MKINWRDCQEYLVHGGAQECALIGSQDNKILPGMASAAIPNAKGIMFFNRAVLPPGEHLELHEGDYEEIYYILSGGGTFSLNDVSFYVRDGDAVLVDPGVTHGIINTTEKDLKYLVMGSSFKKIGVGKDGVIR